MSIGDPPGADDVHAHWERTFSGSSRGISVTDPVSGIMHSVNPAFAAMHGGAAGDFVGRPLSMVLAGGQGLEADHVRLDGSVFPVSCETIITQGEDGAPLYRIAWFEDLTERRADERAHREAGEMFEVAFEDAPSGVALIGLDGRFLRVNAALCKLLGRSPGDIVGGTSASCTRADVAAITVRAYEDLSASATVIAVRKRYIRPEGEVVWASAHGTTVYDAHAAPLRRAHRGHLRAQAARGRPPAPGGQRPADGPVESPPLRGGAEPPAQPLPALRGSRDAAADRPRRVQARQRQLRAQGG